LPEPAPSQWDELEAWESMQPKAVSAQERQRFDTFLSLPFLMDDELGSWQPP